jgi:glycosyltransferase involved in cell wall biosynthesis
MLSENGSISVAIISKGRPEILDDTLASVFRQTIKPQQVIVVVPTKQDLPLKPWGDAVRFLVGPLGICCQRNAAIAACPLSVDYLAFFDDDIELKTDFLEQAALFLRRNPSTIALSGILLADGEGVTREQARARIDGHVQGQSPEGLYVSQGRYHSLHGCNMIVRRSILAYEKFDETLPLYCFAEDYDISVRLERYGNVGKFSLCVAAHLASPGGRVREVLRGYSFVANPLYFLQKGVTHLPPFPSWVRFWMVICGGSFGWAVWKIVTFDSSVDWWGRLKGVLLAFADIVRGRCHPRRILEL